MHKTHQGRTTFGSWDVEKVHAVVARSTFRSHECKKLTGTEHFWTFRCAFAWQAQGIVHLVKSEQNVRVLWHFQKRWQAWDIWRGSAKMHFLWQAQYKRHPHRSCWEVRVLISWEGLHFGASDLEVCWDDFVWQVQHFVWPGITFSWQAQYFRHWYEAVSSALNFPFLKEVSQNCFVFWCCQVEKLKKSRRIASVVMLSTWKNEDVSQNCFVFDVVNFKKWGCLAELLRFWCCQFQKMRMSRRIASFLMLSISKNEEVSQKCCVFDVVNLETWRSLVE